MQGSGYGFSWLSVCATALISVWTYTGLRDTSPFVPEAYSIIAQRLER
jgi:amino acid transporter